MKFLIADDDLISRNVLKKFLTSYGDCDIVVDGKEAIAAFNEAIKKSEPYDLICMDIMMPNMDGMQAVKEIREMEKEIGTVISDGVKVIIISAVENPKAIFETVYREGSFGYLYKPVSKAALIEELRSLGLIE